MLVVARTEEEVTRMAKAAAAPAAGGNGGGGISGTWEKVSTFFRDVRNEMRKVTTPSLKEVQATTTVVIITVALFGIYFWLVDSALLAVVTRVMNYFTGR
jgi:preprotein translocase subunit SecE